MPKVNKNNKSYKDYKIVRGVTYERAKSISGLCGGCVCMDTTEPACREFGICGGNWIWVRAGQKSRAKRATRARTIVPVTPHAQRLLNETHTLLTECAREFYSAMGSTMSVQTATRMFQKCSRMIHKIENLDEQ